MNTATVDDTDQTVTAPLQFTVNDGRPLIANVYQPGESHDKRSGTFEWHDVEIHDGRLIAAQLDLDRQGYQLIRHASAVKNWYDAEEARRVGYPETEVLLKAITGCSKVVVFDHTPRIDDEAMQTARGVRPPARIVHNDFIPESATQRVRDLIVSERHYPDGRIGRIYNVAFNPAQRWVYFPRMMPDEAVLLKCYDSLTDGTARWTAHGSFDPPDKLANTAPRESVELRTMVFWE